MGELIVGIDFHGPSVLGNRLIHTPFLKQSIAEIKMGFGVIRVDFQGLFVEQHCLINLPRLSTNEA